MLHLSVSSMSLLSLSFCLYLPFSLFPFLPLWLPGNFLYFLVLSYPLWLCNVLLLNSSIVCIFKKFLIIIIFVSLSCIFLNVYSLIILSGFSLVVHVADLYIVKKIEHAGFYSLCLIITISEEFKSIFVLLVILLYLMVSCFILFHLTV